MPDKPLQDIFESGMIRRKVGLLVAEGIRYGPGLVGMVEVLDVIPAQVETSGQGRAYQASTAVVDITPLPPAPGLPSLARRSGRSDSSPARC